MRRLARPSILRNFAVERGIRGAAWQAGAEMSHNKIGREMRQLHSWLRTWLPLVGLTLSAFVLNTSEFIPIGMLSLIGDSFGMSDAATSQIISVYSWVVALCSLPLILALARADCRRLFLAIMALFAGFSALSGLAGSFAVLLASRVGVALTHALFWAILVPMAARLAPPGREAAGIGMVMSGTAIAMIVGVPCGRALGLIWGWRLPFLVVAAIAAALFILLFVILPDVKSAVSISIKDLPKLLRKRSLLSVYALTLIIITGNYAGYSFIEPFLAHVAHMPPDGITLTLAVFGASGLLGSYLFARYFDRNPRSFTLASVAGLTLVLLISPLAAMSLPTMVAACIVWGLTFTAYDLVCSADIVRLAPEADTIAMALYSGLFNAAIAGGTMIGGAVQTLVSLNATVTAGGLIAALGLAFYLAKARRLI